MKQKEFEKLVEAGRFKKIEHCEFKHLYEDTEINEKFMLVVDCNDEYIMLRAVE